MKKTNIILIIAIIVLSIALIIMTLMYFNMRESSKRGLESTLNSANEVFELNKKIQSLEEELATYRNPEIKSVTNTLNTITTNTAVFDKNSNVTSTETYIPDEIPVAAPNDTSGIKSSEIEFNSKPENVTIEVLEDTITNTSVEILITDNNEDKYAWGVPFAIQKKVDGEWKDLEYVSDRVAWITIAYNLDKNNQLKQKLDIEEYYGKLEKGIYRVVKTQWSNNVNVDLYSNEFEIK